MDPSALIDLPLNLDDIDFPIYNIMDELYNVTIVSHPHETPRLIEVNSALIRDFVRFAFKDLLDFHYDHDFDRRQMLKSPPNRDHLRPTQGASLSRSSRSLCHFTTGVYHASPLIASRASSQLKGAE